jgi:ornithine decarboxylase
MSAIGRHLAGSPPQPMIEPGRYMVGGAGILRSQVLLIAQRGDRDKRRLVYLDAGRYNGLAETQGESIQHPISTPHDGGTTAQIILAGPTCDSTDIIYDRANYALPVDPAIGDVIEFLTAGADTASSVVPTRACVTCASTELTLRHGRWRIAPEFQIPIRP